MAIDVAAVRGELRALAGKAYFNYGGQGPMPETAIAAVGDCLAKIQSVGPFSEAAGRLVVAQTAQTRAAIAQTLGVSPASLALTEHTTVGCNIALWGLDWQPGDRLLLSDCEHPGIVAVIGEIQRRFGVEVDWWPLRDRARDFGTAAEWTADLLPHLRPQTRLVVLSHVLWNTGDLLPLAEICAACQGYAQSRGGVGLAEPSRPLNVLIDAAQSVGMLPLDLTASGVDFYSFTGHKWLGGPEGLGGLYVRPGVELAPTFIGWRGITIDEANRPTGFKPDARRFEVATSAYPLQAGLAAAIAFHEQSGSASDRFVQIRRNAADLWARLRAVTGVRCWRSTPPETGIVSFQLEQFQPGDHQAIANRLEERGCLVRTIVDPDCLRACVHYFSTEEDLDRLVATLQACLS